MCSSDQPVSRCVMPDSPVAASEYTLVTTSPGEGVRMLASEVFREARNRLFEHGWGQGDWIVNGHICIGAACLLAGGAHLYNGQLQMDAATDDSLLILNEIVQADGYRAYSTWNDQEGRTFDDVIELLELAEKRALIMEETHEAV